MIDYYLYRDLQRGWRVTAPNLEDCGLLAFDYEGCDGEEGLLGEAALWESGFTVRLDRDREESYPRLPLALRSCPPELRGADSCAPSLRSCDGRLAVNVPVQAVNGHCLGCGYRMAWIVIRENSHDLSRLESCASSLRSKAALMF